MHINVSEAFPHQTILLDKVQNPFMLSKMSRGECVKQSKHFDPVFEISAGKFADNKWMTQDLALIEKGLKPDSASPEMLNPY